MIDRIDLRILNESHCVDVEKKNSLHSTQSNETMLLDSQVKKNIRRVVMLRIEMVFRNDYD